MKKQPNPEPGKLRRNDLSQALIREMIQKEIDIDLTLNILNKYNQGDYAEMQPPRVSRLPEKDDPALQDMTQPRERAFTPEQHQRFMDRFREDVSTCTLPSPHPDGSWPLKDKHLREIGQALLPRFAYGVLNGGSATSYVDEKKNREFSPSYFKAVENSFQRIKKESQDKPKGITPAYVLPDGRPGYSFMELKMRALLRMGSIPFFQMTSPFTHDRLEEACREYRRSPLLQPLIDSRGFDITRVRSAMQPMIAAFTNGARDSGEKSIFDRAGGKENSVLALPGGHGQSFLILKDILQGLQREGRKFVSLGNVDNLGYLPDPVQLGLLAVSGRPAGFEFSWKTPVDVKGGILVYDEQEKLNCVDIGPGISREDVVQAEKEGKPLLFNCASGLFDLDYLTDNLDRIIDSLPMRFTDRDRSIGRYSQAEQVTWEVLGLIDDPLIFAVNKYQRFLAAKMLTETLLTSGIGKDDPRTPGELRGLSEKLHTGLQGILAQRCGLTEEGLLPWEPDFEGADGGLVPVIAQEVGSGKVLMQAYMNRRAWQETCRTGAAHYWSRSRQRLWKKGESSGNIQKVEKIRLDCDLDSVLLLVHQEGGAACHEGYASCFYREITPSAAGSVPALGEERIVEERHFQPGDVYGEK